MNPSDYPELTASDRDRIAEILIESMDNLRRCRESLSGAPESQSSITAEIRHRNLLLQRLRP